MTLTPAHWIAPGGEHLDVRTSHIAAVIADPDRFGCEGHARAAIIRYLVTAGWIRTRRTIRPATYWSITLYCLVAETRQRLQTWVDEGLAAHWLKPTSELRIYSVLDGKTSIMEAAELRASR